MADVMSELLSKQRETQRERVKERKRLRPRKRRRLTEPKLERAKIGPPHKASLVSVKATRWTTVGLPRDSVWL